MKKTRAIVRDVSVPELLRVLFPEPRAGPRIKRRLKTEAVYAPESFPDGFGSRVHLFATLKDVQTRQPLPVFTAKKCWWHRGRIPGRPLGCPVQLLRGEEGDEAFLTEGMFCSSRCVKRYIRDQAGDPFYKDSPALLGMMHERLVGAPAEIAEAPSWQLHKDYGGSFGDELWTGDEPGPEYRETIIRDRPCMYPIRAMLEER